MSIRRMTIVVAMLVAGISPAAWGEEFDYVVQPPDVIELEFIGIDDLAEEANGKHIVQPDGSISPGRLGRIDVAGLTLAELRQAITLRVVKSRFRPKSDIAKLVVNIDRQSRGIYIVREETYEIKYLPLREHETAVSAILRIDGLAAVASVGAVTIARPGPETKSLTVDWKAITQRGELASNHNLQPGDRVYVGKRGG